MIRLSRTAPLLIATVASALLVAGPAYAAVPTKPVVGTQECTDAVDADPTVKNAAPDAVAAAKEKATTDLCEATGADDPAGGGTDTGNAANGGAGAGADAGTPGQTGAGQGNSATTGTGDPGSPSSQGNPSSSGNRVSSGAAPKNRPGRPAGDRDCADFATQDEAQSYFESIGGSATNNADRLDANHNGVACESLDDDGDNQNASVTTTGDDESKADCKGDQVTEVPEGSAQTGGEQ